MTTTEEKPKKKSTLNSLIESAKSAGYSKAIDDVLAIVPPHMMDIRIQIYKLIFK